AAEQIGALGAVARAARALLFVHLLAGSPDLGAPLHLVGAGAALGELPDDAALDEILARLQPEDRIRQIDRTLRLAVQSRDLEFHGHAPRAGDAPSLPGGGGSATRNLPGCGASFGNAFLTASRTVIQPPLAPGTAPSTRIRPRSTSVWTTLRLRVVTRSTPIWPGIFLFLNVRPGSWRPPVDPIERCEIDTPWEARRPPKFQRFMPPAKPLPIEVPVTSTNCPTTK